MLASGGCSYPRCGTTGEGYRWVQELGHTIVSPRPALVPIVTDSTWIAALQGIAVPDVLLTLVEDETRSTAGLSARNPSSRDAVRSCLHTSACQGRLHSI